MWNGCRVKKLSRCNVKKNSQPKNDLVVLQVESVCVSIRKNFGNQMLKKYLKSFRIGVVIV